MSGFMTVAHALCCAQDGRCFYCQQQFTGPRTKRVRPGQWTRDHLLPASRNNSAARNIVLACVNCNTRKSDRPATPTEINRAVSVHNKARMLMLAFNGNIPKEWLEPDGAYSASEAARTIGFAP